MTTHPSSIEDEVGTVTAALRIGVDRHPSARQLSAYHRGELSPADTEKLQDHLAQCPDCANLVLDLDRFGDLATKADRAEWEDRREAVWGSLRRSIGGRGWAMRPSSFGYRWVPLAAAALLVLVIGLVGWLALERQAADLARAREQLADAGQRLAQAEERIVELEGEARVGPQLVVPSQDLFPPSFQRSVEGLPTLVIPREARFFLLRLHVAEAGDSPDHELRILRPDGSEVWSGSGLRRTPGGSFRIAVPRRFLPAGRYRLELYGVGEASPRLLGHYELAIEHR